MRENSYTSNFKVLAAVIIAAAVIIGVCGKIGEVYKKAAAENVINAFTKQRLEDFYALPKNSIDMVFIGSSHSYCTFDPANFDVPSFQMGTPLQHPDTSYYELLEVLDYQSPKTVVVEVYWDMLDDDFELKQADSFFEVLNNEERKADYIKEVFPPGDKAKNALPLIKYQQDFFAYASSKLEKKAGEIYGVTKNTAPADTNGTEYYLSDGYVYCDTVIPESEYDKTNQFKGFDGSKWEFSNVQKGYLEKIIKLCKDKNISLIFVTAPIANVSMDYISNYEAVNENISAFAAENNVPYIDYNMVNKSERLLKNENFRDDAHLNDSGVKITDAHFKAWLEKNL